MFRASSSVTLTFAPFWMTLGRPPVSARFWSKSLKEFVSVRNVQVVMEGMTFGMMTFVSVCQPLAPSIFAASSISSDTACNPAM